MDRPLSPCPLVVCLPWSHELGPPAGAVLSVEESEATPLPVDFLGGCTTCWYGIAVHPGSGWQRGSTIWGTRGADVGCVCWARLLRPCAICARAFLSAVPLIMRDLPTPGRPCGAVGNPLDGGPPTREIWRGEARWRCYISRHPCYSGTRSGHASRGGSHSMPWCLLHYLAPQLRGSHLVGSHACALGAQVAAVVAKILILSMFLEAGVGPQLGGPYHSPDWVAVPAGLPQHLVPRRPNPTN